MKEPERKARARRGQRDGAYADPPFPAPAQVEIALAIERYGLQWRDLIRPEHRLHAVWVIPSALVSRGNLSHAAVLVYSVLYSLRTCRPKDAPQQPPFISQQRLAVELGMAVRKVRDATRELERATPPLVRVTRSYSRERNHKGDFTKKQCHYHLLPVEGVNFRWEPRYQAEGGTPRPRRQHLSPPLMFIPRWIAQRKELQPTAKVLYTVLQARAGVSSTRKRREWVALDTAKLAAAAGMFGRKRAGKDDPMFDDLALGVRQVQRNIRTLYRHGLLVPFGSGAACFPVHAWRVQYFTETLPAELEKRQLDAERRAVENTRPDVQNMPVGCSKYADYYQGIYQEGSEGSAGVSYTVERLQTLGEARRARNAAARQARAAKREAQREADPLNTRLRELVNGALAGRDKLSTDEARAVRDAVQYAAMLTAKEYGAEGEAQQRAARYAKAELDRALLENAGVRG